jgi:hypothetical protein
VNDTLDSYIERVDLFHLLELPQLALAMPPIAGALVTILT